MDNVNNACTHPTTKLGQVLVPRNVRRHHGWRVGTKVLSMSTESTLMPCRKCITCGSSWVDRLPMDAA